MQTSPLNEILLPIVLALTMFGMGVTLTVDDFRRVVLYPKATIVGTLTQVLLLPLLGFAMVRVLPVEWEIAVGLMLLTLCPGGPTSNMIAFLARGDAALSVTLTAVSTLVTIVTTPILLGVVIAQLAPGDFNAQFPVLRTIGILLGVVLIPTALGIWLKAKSPETARAWETPTKLFSMVALMLVILGLLIQNRDRLASMFAEAGLVALALNLLALAMGFGLAALFRFSRPQAISIAIDTGNCNGTLAITLAFTVLQDPRLTIAPAIYSLIMLMLGFAIIMVMPQVGRRFKPTIQVEARSLGDMLRRSVGLFGSRAAFLVPTRNEVEEWSYEQLWDKVQGYSAALKHLGMQRGDRVAILSENCAEWALTDWGAQCIGVVTVPIYPTLPADQAQYIVRDSGARLVICGTGEQAKKVDRIEGVKALFLKGPDSLDELAQTASRLPADLLNREIDSTQPEDIATLIYTSGTTGHPKGVILPQRAMLHVCEEARKALPIDHNDTFLCFLPMSHVFERVCGQALPLCIGARIAYSRGLLSLSTDMQKMQPTIMLAVPRFLEATMDKILDNAEKAPWLDRWLFKKALQQNKKRVRHGWAPFSMLLDMLVLANVRDRVGGKLRIFGSGGAALPPAVAEFYAACGFTILQGYGLTETAGGTFVNRPKSNKYWTVGETLGMETKIAPDGEILLRGPGLMLGYYNLPEETAKAIDEEGWFHTGDIGEFEGRHLKITDRKKDILVLANGKNVAPQMVENKLRETELIQEAVVFGDGMDHCCALIVPQFELIRNRFEDLSRATEAEIIADERVRAAIKHDIATVNKTLANYEVVKRHVLLEEPFTVEKGELTPTFKVKRKVVRERHAPKIESMAH